MNRRLRRELSKKKWISRAKKVYHSCGRFWVPVKGIKAVVKYNKPAYLNKDLKQCESITEFLDSSIFAKRLKDCTTSYRTKTSQYEYKKENRKNRHKSKISVQEGLKEYENLYKEDCFSCVHYDKGLCSKNLVMKDDCPEYWD